MKYTKRERDISERIDFALGVSTTGNVPVLIVTVARPTHLWIYILNTYDTLSVSEIPSLLR